MKKLLPLFLLPLVMLFSCNDDKDFSPVDMTLTLSGVTYLDGTFYTVQGETVVINSFTAKSIDGRNTGVTNVLFDLNGAPLFPSPSEGGIINIPTANLPAGNYEVGVSGNLLQVDSSIGMFAASYPLVVVADVEELPESAQEIGTFSSTLRFTE